MALLLPQCTTAPPESLHQLASLRQRLSVQQRHHRSRRSARAKHGATESSSPRSANDHIRVSSTEPCCTISSLVMVPRKPARRSSRLRAKKGREGAKTEPSANDMEAAEWVRTVLANNGLVEIDPVTMAAVSAGKTGSANTPNRIASLTTSSEVPDYFPPRGSGFPRFPGVPFEVIVAAGSAVALATIAAILNTVSNQRIGAKPSQSESGASEVTKGKELPADVLASTAAGAAILTAFDLQPGSVRTGVDYTSMPLPPSLSKNGPPQQEQGKWESVTPFFTSSRSSSAEATPKPAPSRWSEEKYKSVTPFFADEQSAANGSSLESVTPFFADEQQGSGSQEGASVESVTPFFADDRGREVKNGVSLEGVTPFFADEQQGSGSQNGVSLEGVTPFFADEQQGSGSQNGVSLEGVTPFFADEQQGSGSQNGVSLEGVTPFFADEQQGSGSQNGVSLENVTPFFADEQQGRSSAGVSQANGKYQSVTPFFPDDRGFREQQSGSGDGESTEAMRESLADAMSPDSAPKLPKMVNLRRETPVSSTQFTDPKSVGDERVFAAVPEDLLSGPMQSEGKQMLADIANRSQDQHREFIDSTPKDRLASSFEGVEAPSVARDLTPEELALLEEIKAEEARQHAKFRALQAAFPALAIGAGAVGALVGVDGAFEMVGLTATASFISYELLWANKREELLDEISRISDHHKLFNFLQKRKIVKDDC